MFKNIFRHVVSSRRKEIPFIVFATFLVTFSLARLVVYLIQIGYLPYWLMLHIRGIHIHHLAYGIFILALAGFFALVDNSRKHLYQIAILYAIGLGLAFDEFGMWIMLEENYWHRINYDAIIYITAFFLSIIYFRPFWQKVGSVIKGNLYKFRSLASEHRKTKIINNSYPESRPPTTPPE